MKIIKLRKHEAKEISRVLSHKKENSVQITSAMTCPVMCEYCPQETLQKSKGLSKEMLELADFKRYLQNIPKETIIRWTGYSEPLLAKEFPEMVLHAEKKGYKQVLSTTLAGHKRCQEFLIEYANFNHINFHVQDIGNNMKRLKLSSGYLEVFKLIFRRQWEALKTRGKKVTIQCWGDAIHPLVDKAINECAEELSIKSTDLQKVTKLSKNISSRTGDVNNSNFNHQLMNKPNSNIPLKYFCKKQSLSNPVLMPNGKLNICCDNYSLDNIKGSLKSNSYNEIQKNWFDNHWEDFVNGKLNPCTKCEHYAATVLPMLDSI